jgi:trehalose-phosphatase
VIGDPALARLAAAPALFVGMDYDGTLAGIVSHPSQATLVDGAQAALARLAAAPGTALGVFTGRTLHDIRQRIALPDLCYAGNHGLEMVWGDRRRDDPEAARRVSALAALAADLGALAAEEPGAWVEPKGLSLSLHVRNVAPERQAAFAERVAHWLDARGGAFAREAGKAVIEIRPAGVPGKEAAFRLALEWAADRLGRRPVPAFFGDDAGDEAALEVARAAAGLAVAVGERPSAAATHHLAGPADVAVVLAWLADARTRT